MVVCIELLYYSIARCTVGLFILGRAFSFCAAKHILEGRSVILDGPLAGWSVVYAPYLMNGRFGETRQKEQWTLLVVGPQSSRHKVTSKFGVF